MYNLAYLMNIKKDKTPVRELLRWMNGKKCSDIQLAKYLSSLQTHCLIDIEESGEPERINSYKLVELSDLYSSFIVGKLSQDEVKKQLEILIKED